MLFNKKTQFNLNNNQVLINFFKKTPLFFNCKINNNNFFYNFSTFSDKKSDVSIIIDSLRPKIDELDKQDLNWSPIGVVAALKDGVATISGLPDLGYGDLVSFENGTAGLAVSLENDFAKVVVLGDDREIKAGQIVVCKSLTPTIAINSSILGHIIDIFGNILDNRPVLNNNEEIYNQHIEIKAPGIVMRRKVDQPVYTGVKIVDSMLPIGKGQRELIIGDRQTGKTTIAIDSIISQKNNKRSFYDIVYCIYVAIGQKRSSVLHIFEKLIQNNSIDYTVIVSATASEPASLQYLAPYAAATIGEFFRDSGRHALIIYDDLTKHAVAYRQISLLLRRPPGREAYPGDIFYLHSRLLERSAKLNEIFGAGSLTALPVIETQAGDVSAYIPTNVISITDGQLFLETHLFHKGIRPAINIGISVSRIGAAAQTKPMRQVAGSLKLELAQFREVEMFMTFGSDIDDITKRILMRGLRLVELLKQPHYDPLSIDYQVVLIYAVLKGYLDNLSLDKVKIFENRIISSELPYILTVRGQNRFLNQNLKKQALDSFVEKNLTNL